HLDTKSAARLGAGDSTRVARALEVLLSTGRPLHDWQSERLGGIGSEIDLTAMILLPERQWLGERIDRRFAWMADVALGEVAALLERTDVPADAPILRAIGVSELGQVLRGQIDPEQAISAGSLATRQYAKRQYTWFRRQSPDTWHRNEETQTDRLLAYFETKCLI
ncbi:MAG: tRNA (adenosine(37)-N6)-dimethylallyltransferase MiaA, partial [Sphingomonadales bacterium]